MRSPSRLVSLRPCTLVCLALVAALFGPERSAAETPTPPAFAELFAAGAGGKRADQAAWSEEGTLLGYRWDDGDGQGLWAFDPSARSHKLLLRADQEGIGSLDAFHWVPGSSADGWKLVLESRGDLYLVRGSWTDKLEVFQLTATPEEESDPKISPAGDRVAFVRGADLYMIELPDGSDGTANERALTTGGKADEILHGTTDWVYWEEIWGRQGTGFWWSPDGRRIAYYLFEEAPVATYPLVAERPTPEDTGAEILEAGTEVAQYPRVMPQKYPKAGTANPVVRLGILDLGSPDQPVTPGKTTWLETGNPADAYLARVHWFEAGEAVAVERLNRDQNHLDLLRCSPTTGACQVLLSESAATWVNITDSTHILDDGRFLWLSERNGWAHLYLYSKDGELIRRLTDGERNVSLVAVQGAAQGPPQAVISISHPQLAGNSLLGNAGRRLERIALSDRAGERPAEVLSGNPGQSRGWHAAALPSKATLGSPWLHTWSNSDDPGWQVVRGPGGAELGRLPSTAPDFDLAKLPSWEFLTVPGPEGTSLPARRLRATTASALAAAAPKAPAVIYHYGGPESQVVVDRWDRRNRDLWHKWMATRGYEVLMVDNQASNYFGKYGADRIHRRFGEVNLAAQQAAVAFLAAEGQVDPDRIGLWGWSGGGSNTLYCLLKSPGTWKAGVAGAPVTDWRFYDTIWTERYMDRPQDNPEGYRASSALTHAGLLEDRLLIVHGTADDNVHPQNTFVFMGALIDAGLPFEDAIYPGQKHGFKAPEFAHFLARMAEFFDRHLAAE